MKNPVLIDIDIDYFVKPVYQNTVNGIRLYKDELCIIENVHDFFKKLETKISIPQEKHIFTNHRKSYIYWWMKRLKNCTLIHIDAHSDLYRNKQNDLRHLSDVDMNCDDYLWYALRDDFIDEIFWVCPDEFIDTACMDKLEKMFSPSMIKSVGTENGMINVNLDIITRSVFGKIIKVHILKIDDLPCFNTKSLMLTMATSPEFIPASADILIDQVNSVIGFDDSSVLNIKKQHHKMLHAAEEEYAKARLLLDKELI